MADDQRYPVTPKPAPKPAVPPGADTTGQVIRRRGVAGGGWRVAAEDLPFSATRHPPPNTMSLRDQIAAAPDLAPVPVPTPEWPAVNGQLHVRPWTAAERDAFENVRSRLAEAGVSADGKRLLDRTGIQAQLVVLTTVERPGGAASSPTPTRRSCRAKTPGRSSGCSTPRPRSTWSRTSALWRVGALRLLAQPRAGPDQGGAARLDLGRGAGPLARCTWPGRGAPSAMSSAPASWPRRRSTATRTAAARSNPSSSSRGWRRRCRWRRTRAPRCGTRWRR